MDSRFPDQKVIIEILERDPPFANFGDQQACEILIDELTEEELEMVARTSYAYWVFSVQNKQTESQQRKAALKECRRQYVGENRDIDKARIKLQNTIEYRRSRRPDILRSCMIDDFEWYKDDEEKELAAKYRSYVEDDTSKQVLVVQGYDLESRPIVVKHARMSAETVPEAYIMTQLYVTERLLAATEVVSRGTEEKIVGLFDFGSYQSSHQPPYATIKDIAMILQKSYPERLKNLYILNPPYWLRSLLYLLSVFLDPDTREKIQALVGLEQTREVLESRISSEELSRLLLPDGQLRRDIDMNHFIKNIPFHLTYNDMPVADDQVVGDA